MLIAENIAAVFGMYQSTAPYVSVRIETIRCATCSLLGCRSTKTSITNCDERNLDVRMHFGIVMAIYGCVRVQYSEKENFSSSFHTH